MNIKYLFGAALLSAVTLLSCQDEVSGLGGSLTSGEVSITVDSIETVLESSSVYYDRFDGRNTTKLLGRISVPEYGSLDCSFVSQMMCATKMNIPDSIPVTDIDSMRLVLSVPRGSLTGDSLAPQQLRVFRLDRQLPSDITSAFDPAGYYDASSPMGSASYTLSNIAKGDSALKNEAYVRIPVDMPLSFARELFEKYRADDPMFQWPSTFNQYFPGIYVRQNFGNGCVANIAKAEFFTYWHRINRTYDKQEDDTYEYVDHIVRDSVCLLASQPEVISSNLIGYKVSDYIKGLAESGKSVVTTPGGYMVDIKFPVLRLLDVYHSHGDAMSVVSSLRMTIPASEIENDYGLTVAPYLLMVRKSEREEFFRDNKVPDGVTSFYAAYDSEKGNYQFSSMRSYFLKILEAEQKGETISDADMEFTFVPVNITTETVNNYNTTAVYVTKCQPYLTKPTMTDLKTDKAVICFTYSSQQID